LRKGVLPFSSFTKWWQAGSHLFHRNLRLWGWRNLWRVEWSTQVLIGCGKPDDKTTAYLQDFLSWLLDRRYTTAAELENGYGGAG